MECYIGINNSIPSSSVNAAALLAENPTKFYMLNKMNSMFAIFYELKVVKLFTKPNKKNCIYEENVLLVVTNPWLKSK